jgi:hypothetical protein
MMNAKRFCNDGDKRAVHLLAGLVGRGEDKSTGSVNFEVDAGMMQPQ